MKKLLIVFIVLLIATLSCAPSDAGQLEDPAEAKWFARVMSKEYAQNPVRFGLARMGSQFHVHGKIQRITADGLRFDNGFMKEGNHLECRFSYMDELVDLSRGDKVTVVGTVESIGRPSLSSRVLYMVDCELVGK